jgi:hypothetical protein
MGCTLLPPHWQISDVPRLPYVEYAPAPDVRNLPFPAGDRAELPADGLDNRYRALAPVLERAFDGKSHGESAGVVTTAVIVAKGGKIVAERYRPGFGIYSGYRTWSTAKSISAALIGIAAGQGLLDIDAGRHPGVVPPGRSAADPHLQAPAVDVQRVVQRRLEQQCSLLRRAGRHQRSYDDVRGSPTGYALEVRQQRHAATAACAASPTRR